MSPLTSLLSPPMALLMTRTLPRRRPPPFPLPFVIFLTALQTAPRPLPPPLAGLWIPPTESRRMPPPLPTLVWMLTRIRFQLHNSDDVNGSMLPQTLKDDSGGPMASEIWA